MTEEIKEDNNCIIKAFENNPISIIKEEDNNKKIYYFKASDIGKALNLTNIAVSIQSYDEDEKVLRKAYDIRGCEQETSFLSSQGVYRLLYNSKKPLAKKFRKWAGAILDDIIFNESIELKNQLEEKDKEIKQIHHERITDKKLEKHKVLLNILNDKNCIYLIELSENLIKVGSSLDISKRCNMIKNVYGGEGIFLDVFECNEFRNVERNILNDKVIQENKFKDKLDTGHISNEVIKLSNAFTYNQLVEIVEKHINNHNFLTPRQLLEKQKLDIIESLIKNGEKLTDIINVFSTPLTITQNTPNIIENEKKEETKDIITIRHNYGRHIQKIDPNNLTRIVKLYKNMETLMEEKKYDVFSETGVREAIKNNTIYKKYRWMFVDNDKDPMIVHNIQPTVVSKKGGCTVILELNNDKSAITRHFISLNVLFFELKISKHSIKRIIVNKKLYNNHYYIYLDECPRELLDKYDTKVFNYVPKGAVKVKCIHPETKEEQIFPSLTHAYKFCKVHHKTIYKAINEKTILNGYYWELV
jgi:prophage antirepressor-like protein